jgi:phospholipase/carboxylesterase
MQTARVHLPEDFDPQSGYDLVLALHGYSGDVSEFSARWDAFEGKDFIYVSLQAPYAFERNGRTVYSWAVFGSSPWDGQDMPEDQMEETYGASMDLSSDMVLACVEELRELYSIDNVFLLGFSQGGILTYRTAIANPEVFDGIATFSGVLDQDTATDQALETASGLPVFLGRGTQEDDRAVLARDRLVEAGFDVTFHEYQGGHYFPDSSLRAFEGWILNLD